jgi:ferredoxin
MKVRIDPERCQGHARCYQLAAEVFGLDEEGHGEVLVEEVPPEHQDAALNAVRNCPERAILAED